MLNLVGLLALHFLCQQAFHQCFVLDLIESVDVFDFLIAPLLLLLEIPLVHFVESDTAFLFGFRFFLKQLLSVRPFSLLGCEDIA